MIVSLDEVKDALGISGTDEDEALTGMIDHAAAFIEGQTKRRFDEPIARVEYQRNNSTNTIYLAGHIDVADEDASPDDIIVSERVFGVIDWTVIDSAEYERRGDMIIRLGWWWEWNLEYKLEYMDGYTEAPIDIQKLAMELVIGEYNANTAVDDGSSRLTSETLVGVYSYTASDASARAESAVGGGMISPTGQQTIQRYKRKLV